MSSFRLDLPTDIPWKRICVSREMLDPVGCDLDRPDRWKPSIAVFRYDPGEDYQPFEDRILSYLKVVVTVTPFMPEIDYERAGRYLPPVLVEDLEEAFPCYGALLQVNVSPTHEDIERFGLEDFPHFVDFEPKKRELYEAVTDTGEVLSGSSTTLAIGKSAQQTDTTENYNIDTGWNFGMNASYAGTGGGFNTGETGQWGTADKSGLQTTNIRTTEESTERRERQSHTTQLAQMYNLFQAFHLGTNRALFFLEPRPHIRQSEATFINGPRALEGIQEVFLVVSRPKEMTDYCPSVLLELAHLTKTPVYEYEESSHLIEFRLYANAQNKDTTSGETDWTETVAHTETYNIPSGWEVDTSKGSGGYDVSILREARRRTGPTVSVSSTSVSVYAEVTWRFWESGLFNDDHYADGYLDANVTVYLRKKEPDLKEMTEHLFLSARDLCCCPDPGVVTGPWISWVGDVPQVAIQHDYATRARVKESRQLAGRIRDQMIRSVGSSRRYPRGTVTYEQSDLYFGRVARLLIARRTNREFQVPFEKTDLLDEKTRRTIHESLGSIDAAELLQLRADELAAAVGASEAEAVELKSRLLGQLRKTATRGPRRRGRSRGDDPGRGDDKGRGDEPTSA